MSGNFFATLRVDNGKVALTLHRLNEHFLELNLIDVVDNSNNKVKHIVKKVYILTLREKVGSTCTNLILSNSCRSFQDTFTVETGLSDFHKLVVTVLKLYFTKQKPNIQTFQDYKKFENDLVRSELGYELSKL